MNKKLVNIGVILFIIICVTAGVLFFFKKVWNKDSDSDSSSSSKTEEYYGKRGKISEIETVSFLTKGEDLLVGMMALPPNTVETAFSEDNMINFALYVAQERYGNMLTEKKSKSGEYDYYIQPEVIDSIISEFFGRTDIVYSPDSEAYNFSQSANCFIFKQDLQKTLWYYPVSQETTEDRIIITVDGVYINDDQEESVLREAKYGGKYKKEKVDNTVKFIYNKDGYLIAYQYVSEDAPAPTETPVEETPAEAPVEEVVE